MGTIIDITQAIQYLKFLENIILYLKDFNFISICVRLMLAVLLSSIVGIERSKSGRTAGLRTHVLICLGSTIASMTGLYVTTMHATGDATRIAAQVVSGIGFLGAGTILVRNNVTVKGLTTSACIWAVGTVGIALGYGFYETAIIGTVLVSFVTKKLGVVDRKIKNNVKEMDIYIEFINAKQLNNTLFTMKELGFYIENIQIVKTKTNLIDGVGADISLHLKEDCDADEMIKQLNKLENVNFAILVA